LSSSCADPSAREDVFLELAITDDEGAVDQELAEAFGILGGILKGGFVDDMTWSKTEMSASAPILTRHSAASVATSLRDVAQV
jgi:hypothetical protein